MVANWLTAARTIAPVQTIGMVGSEPEEPEETTSSQYGKSRFSFETSLTTTIDSERQETFPYLEELRKQKRLKQKLERRNEAREQMRAEMDSVLREEEKESRSESRGIMTKKAGVGIS